MLRPGDRVKYLHLGGVFGIIEPSNDLYFVIRYCILGDNRLEHYTLTYYKNDKERMEREWVVI